jgi:glycosyltransferase involved in cell wall biosynthesis
MKISIITPTYNSAKTISRTIDSIIDQNYLDLEYIIIDGLSTDNTKDILSTYQNKINIKFVSEKDNGIFDAMNKGIKMTTGEIIGVLNSDDFYCDGSVLSIVAQSFKDQNIDAVYGDISYFSDDINKVVRYWRAGEYKESKLNNGWIIPHPSLFLRRSVYDRCGLFNTDLKVAADYEFILKILKAYKIQTKYIPKVFTRMYNGGNSGESLKKRIEGWKDLKNSWTTNGFKVPPFFILRRILFKLSQYI